MLDLGQLEQVNWQQVITHAKECAEKSLSKQLPSEFKGEAGSLLGEFLKQPPIVDDEQVFFERLVEHAWNRRGGGNVVRRGVLCWPTWRSALCNYDPHALHDRYPVFDDWQQLREDLIRQGAIRTATRNSLWWTTVPKAIVSGAALIARGLRLHHRNEMEAALGLIHRIQHSVHGYGFALACDLTGRILRDDCANSLTPSRIDPTAPRRC